jgi:hypothetical protein
VPPERQSAMARIYENRMLIAWVHRRFGERLIGYKLALDRLVVATPAPAAIEAERVLQVLEAGLAEFMPSAHLAAVTPPPPPSDIVLGK